VEVTGVRITKLHSKSKVQAFVDITFDKLLTVKGFRLVMGERGLWLAPPSKQDKKDPAKYHDDVIFVGADKQTTDGYRFRQYVQDAVIRKYNEGVAEDRGHNQAAEQDARDVEYKGDKLPF